MAYTFVPSAAATTTAATVIYGVQDLLTDYILQDVTVTQDTNSIQIPDQQGAIAQIRPMQGHWTMSFTAIGPATAPATVGETKTISNIVYYVNSCERRATYNDTQKWAVQMEAWEGATVGSSTLGPSA